MALSAAIVTPAQQDKGTMDPVALMAGVRDRNRTALEKIFTHFGPRIKALMQRSGADPALAEDIMQDVFVTVWTKADQYDSRRGSVSAWIFTIARNARIDRLRRQSSSPYEDVESLDLPDDSDGAEELIYADQRAELVTKAIDELPCEQRSIIELAFMHDMKQTEIAARLTIPLGTVKSRTRLAFAKLKQRLEAIK